MSRALVANRQIRVMCTRTPSMRRSSNEDVTSPSEKWALIVNCVRHRSTMFSQSIATSQQSLNGQIVSMWPNRLHTSHSACGQFCSECPISSHVLHWWYGQSDDLLVLCWNRTRNIACWDDWLLCALAVRMSCKMCIRSRDVRRCCSECRHDSCTLCYIRVGGALHLCIPCNIWGNFDIRSRDLRSYSDRKPSRRGREVHNGTNQLV
jgi:hypothetical protein